MIKRSCREVMSERKTWYNGRPELRGSMMGCGTWRCQPSTDCLLSLVSADVLPTLLLFWPNNTNTMGDEELWRNRGWFGWVVAGIKGRLGVVLQAFSVSPPLVSQSKSISLPSSSSFSFSLLLWR